MSARKHVEERLARIAEVDGSINAVCTLNPGALTQAMALDGDPSRGPLHGQVVLVKDNIDTADMITTAGSLALADQPPPTRDAPLVRRLREAGMVVLGKTNLSEWANIRDAMSTSGWSGYGGLTRNPYALNRSAGGSSSGSGAAVAAGLTAYAIGTETDGSISCPAAFNGCVGIKPTVGLVPTKGVVPISVSQDSPGPMATTVAQAAGLLGVLARDGVDYAAHAIPGRLEGKRIGVARHDFWGYSPHADAAGERALSLLSDAGATIVDGTEIAAMEGFNGDDELLVLLSELRSGLAGDLTGRPGDGPRTLEDVVAFNRAHADTELAHFGQSLFEAALDGPEYMSKEYAEARARCVAASRDGMDAVIREHSIDAFLAPSYAPACPIDLVNAEAQSGACTQPSAMAGYPILTLPMQLAAGLPVAVSVWGAAGSEATLIEIGAGLEALREPLPPPELNPWV